jgi:hypothetical protein
LLVLRHALGAHGWWILVPSTTTGVNFSRSSKVLSNNNSKVAIVRPRHAPRFFPAKMTFQRVFYDRHGLWTPPSSTPATARRHSAAPLCQIFYYKTLSFFFITIHGLLILQYSPFTAKRYVSSSCSEKQQVRALSSLLSIFGSRRAHVGLMPARI